MGVLAAWRKERLGETDTYCEEEAFPSLIIPSVEAV